jgi:hypothetical protein
VAGREDAAESAEMQLMFRVLSFQAIIQPVIPVAKLVLE